jgi:hypothetical protein
MSLFIPNTSGVYLTGIFAYPVTTKDITIMQWINLSAGGPAAHRGFVNLVNTTTGSSMFLSTNNDGLTLDFGTSSNNYLGSLLTAGTWYHVATTFINISSTSRIISGYLNGVQQVHASDTTTFVDATNIIVGNYGGGGNYTYPLFGNVRDVRIFRHCMNPFEIKREMQSSRPVARDIAAWYLLDDNLTQDKSGQNITLTTVGAGTALQAGPLFQTTYQAHGKNFIL